MRIHQETWKLKNLTHISKKGWHNGHQYDHVLPKSNTEDNFYPSIRKELFDPIKGYLVVNKVKPHTGVHNLLSSWAMCANMYWPFNNPEGKKLIATYFKAQTGLDTKTVESLELEFADTDTTFQPARLLGEDDHGLRGSGQTSPDLAILFKTSNGEDGILLIESKFTEHNFYGCSAYKKQKPGGRIPNPNNKRCLNTKGILASGYSDCHLNIWGRKYWELLGGDLNKPKFATLSKCPMSNCCYQLFRQQALAKGLQKEYSISASYVAMDGRNSTLINSGKRTGLKPFPDGWQELFPSLPFYWFTHQDWFEFVKANDKGGRWSDWIEYIGERYDL